MKLSLSLPLNISQDDLHLFAQMQEEAKRRKLHDA